MTQDWKDAEITRLRARLAKIEGGIHADQPDGLIAGPIPNAVTPPATADMLFAALEKTRMPMILTDPHRPDNPIILANRAFQVLSGYSAEQLVGRNCRFLQGPQTNPEDVRKVREAITARRDVVVDILNYRDDGSTFINELYISPVFDRNGALLYFFGSQVDVSQYAEDRQRLKESEERYRSLFTSIDSGFCVFEMKYDDDGRAIDYRFIEVNPAFAEQTGLHDPVGRWMRDLLPEHEQYWFDTYGDVARDQRGIRLERHAVALGRYYEIHAYPVGNPGAFRVAALFTDITARKRIEADLRALTETLEQQVAARTQELMAIEETLRQSQKMEAIGQLTGGVAHDFNNLLTIIRSAAEFLQRDGLAAERRARYVQAIVDTSERAARLTNQLLAFARRQPLKAELFAVDEHIATIVSLVRPLVGNGIEIVVEQCGEHGCRVEADPSQFETALVNLIVNARDAMGDTGRLRLSARSVADIPPVRHHPARAGRFVAISVADSGCGIAASDLERIFEPFFTTKEAGKGTGLGLSQVFGFAKQSGGEVIVESSPAGSMFTLFLPAHAGATASEPAEPAAVALAPGACILVVEDNEEVGRFSTDLLHDLGHRTIWVSDAAAALERLKEKPDAFDLVFSDVMMPGMNGVELGREIHRAYPRLPVVLTSGYSDVLAEQGVHGFELVRKPYSMDTLSRALARAVVDRDG